MYEIKGIITDSKEGTWDIPQKRLAVMVSATRKIIGVSVALNTKHTPGKLKQALCDALGCPTNMVNLSKRLKEIIRGPG